MYRHGVDEGDIAAGIVFLVIVLSVSSVVRSASPVVGIHAGIHPIRQC